MRCALMFYVVVRIFVVVYSRLLELCEFKDEINWGRYALCGRDDVKYIFDFIPPISQCISSIDLQKQPLKQLPYNAFRNLSSQTSISEIWLQGCHISHVDAGAFLNLYNLTDIHLSFNDIKQLDSKLFSDTKQIKYIDMDYNKIEVLPNGLFQNLTLLQVVYLEHNRIRQVEWNSFKNTPLLWIIDLSYNQIEFMNMLFKDKFDNLRTLSLYGNPWKCDCELGPLYELLIKKNQIYDEQLVCEKPPTLQGRKWKDVSSEKFVCHSEDAISTEDSEMTSTQPMTITEQDDNIPVTGYNVSMSTRDSVMTSTEPMTTTEQDDNIFVTSYNASILTDDSVTTSAEPMTSIEADNNIPVSVHNGTKYQPDDTDIPQPHSNQNWIANTILVLMLLCIVPVIIGVVFHVNRTQTIRLINTHNMDSDLSMRIIQSRAVSENGDSTSNPDDVDKEQTPFHHCEIYDATIN